MKSSQTQVHFIAERNQFAHLFLASEHQTSVQ